MNTELRQNYYEILDIKENATQQEIHAAYEKAKMTYSNDNKALSSVFSSEEANELRKLIDEAFQVLSNNDYRNVYEKRVLANTYAPIDLTVEAIKEASDNLFEKAAPPMVDLEIIEPSEAPVVDFEFENLIAGKREWAGEDLKQVREYRKLSFDELTDITKINPWYIAAIEKMDAANLPVEVFVRGYVLQVAKALGLKDKVVADSYMRLFRKKIEN